MHDLIILDEVLEISTAASTREEWQTYLKSGLGKIEVAVNRLTRVDTAGVQLLLALKKEVIAEGRTFVITGESAALRAQVDTLGVSSVLIDADDR